MDVPSVSTASTRMSSRQKDKIFLIGYMSHQITGSKLPCNCQVLRSLFYNMRQVKLNNREAARLTIQEVLIFWEKVKIPTKHMKDCVAKLEKLYDEWRKLQKNAARSTSATQNRKVEAFKSTLDDLFDVAHQDALTNTTEEGRQFLLQQREKGRPGCMGGVDMKFVKAEQRREKRRAAEMARLKKSRENLGEEHVELESVPSTISTSEEEEPMQVDTEYNFPYPEKAGPEIKRRKYCRGTEEIITEKLSLLLDRCSISDRDAVRIITATAEALGHDPQNLIVSRSIIRLRRQQFRHQRTDLIKNRFRNSDLEGAVVHWDGKLLSDILSKENIERLAILISCGNEEQLIGVPQLENSMGITQARAVFSAVEQWGAAGKIQAMCFDTTAINTGRLKGTCVLLEQLLEKNLLYLACRHHILEVVLKAVFNCKMGTTTGPQPDIFKKFQTGWSKLDKTKYKAGIEEENICHKISNVDQISSFLFGQLKNQQPRNDYEEFIQLCLIFLGRLPQKDISFRVPGAIHHARWMAKAIYSLKIYLFRNQFSLTDLEKKGIEDICLFIINIFVKAWFNAPKPTLAPNQDLELLKSFVKYRKIDEEVADKALSKMINHLWYLNSEQVAFSFFDDTLGKNTKINMVRKLTSERKYDEDDCDNRDVKATLSLKEVDNLLDKEVDFFVSPRTLNFFERFEIDTEFLNTDPDIWCENLHYLKAKKIVNGLRVVNDTAERGVKLIQDFNSCLTKDEEQRQFLLQVVSECRHIYPDSSKSTLSKALPP